MSEGAEKMRLARRRRRAEGGLAKDDPRHGTANGYDYHGCRCDACRRAAVERVKPTRPWRPRDHAE